MSIYPTMLKRANQLTIFGMSVAVTGGVISYKILQIIVCFLSGKCVGHPLFVQTERWFESILAITRSRIYSCDRLVLLKDWWTGAIGMPVGGFRSFTPT